MMQKLLKKNNYSEVLTILLSRLLLVNSTGSEYRFYCPFCEELTGKPDNDGHLYFNAFKNEGVCFKHNKVVTLEMIQKLEIINADYFLGLDSYIPDIDYNKIKSDYAKDLFNNNFEFITQNDDEYFIYIIKRLNFYEDYKLFYKNIQKSDNKFKNRISIPFTDQELFHYVTRSITKCKKRYVNSKTNFSSLLFKSPTFRFKDQFTLLNGIDVRSNSVILVEGLFDALNVGYPATCMFGKLLKKRQIESLIKDKFILNTTEIIIFLDNDAIKFMIDIYTKLNYWFLKITFAICPENSDPAELTIDEIREVIQNRITFQEFEQKYILTDSPVYKI